MTDALPPLRRATPDDAPEMAQIVADWVARTPWADRLHSAAQIAEFILDAMPRREIWVAGKPVQGYLSMDPETARVGGLYCATRGAGLGRALMDRAKEGRDRLWLHTYEPNSRARAFYAREGFTETAVCPPEPPGTVTEIRMEWVRHA